MGDFEESTTASLWALIGWIREMLEKIHRDAKERHIRWSLHSVIRATDPQTNPRLREAMKKPGDSREGGEGGR